MSVGASADDLEEIASGRSSARDMAEAGVSSRREAQARLKTLRARQGGHKVTTSVKHHPHQRYKP